jgi:hypothetical protein
MFKYKGGYFVNNKNNKVFSVKDKKDEEAQPVNVENRRGNHRGKD